VERIPRQELAARADAICATYNRQTKNLRNPRDVSALAEYADRTLPLLDDAIGDLRALRPPEAEQAAYDRWLALVGTLKTELTEIRDRANANDLAGIRALLPRATEHNTRSNELATTLGMRVCNKG